MPEDVAHTLAFDRVAGCARGHEWQVVHLDMNAMARPCGIESLRLPKAHTKLEHTGVTSFSTKAIFLLCNDHDRNNMHFEANLRQEATRFVQLHST